MIGANVVIDKKGAKYKITNKDIDDVIDIYYDFYKNHNESEMFPMHLIADMGNAGRALLLKSSWHGEINLKNKEQKETFKNYINKV